MAWNTQLNQKNPIAYMPSIQHLESTSTKQIMVNFDEHQAKVLPVPASV